jgi:hypothetical protein
VFASAGALNAEKLRVETSKTAINAGSFVLWA